MTLLPSFGYLSHVDYRDECFPNTSNIIFVVPNGHPAQQLDNALACSIRLWDEFPWNSSGFFSLLLAAKRGRLEQNFWYGLIKFWTRSRVWVVRGGRGSEWQCKLEEQKGWCLLWGLASASIKMTDKIIASHKPSCHLKHFDVLMHKLDGDEGSGELLSE